jgi:hypothetical protein
MCEMKDSHAEDQQFRTFLWTSFRAGALFSACKLVHIFLYVRKKTVKTFLQIFGVTSEKLVVRKTRCPEFSHPSTDHIKN